MAYTSRRAMQLKMLQETVSDTYGRYTPSAMIKQSPIMNRMDPTTDRMQAGLLLHTQRVVMFMVKLTYWSHLMHLTSLLVLRQGLICLIKHSSWQKSKHLQIDMHYSQWSLVWQKLQNSPNGFSQLYDISSNLCFFPNSLCFKSASLSQICVIRFLYFKLMQQFSIQPPSLFFPFLRYQMSLHLSSLSPFFVCHPYYEQKQQNEVKQLDLLSGKAGKDYNKPLETQVGKETQKNKTMWLSQGLKSD